MGHKGKFLHHLSYEWVAAALNSTESTQRDIFEQILLHYPKRLARWIAQHCPERLLPNKESAGILDALEGWNKPDSTGDYFSGIGVPYTSSGKWVIHPSTRITQPHNGNNKNIPSK